MQTKKEKNYRRKERKTMCILQIRKESGNRTKKNERGGGRVTGKIGENIVTATGSK